ncbi:MAG: hypothetical protein ACTHU0_16405 [Kofleriaceae bacterium]
MAIAVLAASQLGATCGPILSDPGFDLWCGDRLCAWTVVRGDTRRTGTWHDGDPGVELVGDDAAIAQLSPVRSFPFGDQSPDDCIRFELVTHVEETAEAFLEIDLFGDGTVERTERMPTSQWKLVSYHLRLAPPYDGVRFVLSKRGPGRVVLARIGATFLDAAECAGLTPIAGGPAPLGAGCTLDEQCASHKCQLVDDPRSVIGESPRCVGCDDASGCGGGDVCGIGEPTSPVRLPPTECVAAGGDELGAQCRVDGECASGRCADGLCASCRSSADCAGGATCGTAYPLGPRVCGPNSTTGAPGAPCSIDQDCASLRCNGAERWICEIDGRPCGDSTDCPLDGALSPSACNRVGVLGGTCQ